MSSAYATKIAEGFSNKLMKEVYELSLTDKIVNRDYQGEVNSVGSKLNILNLARISEKTFSGANLTVDSLYENNAVLTIDQFKSFYWKEMVLDKWKSYIKNPHATVVAQKADERARNMDLFVLGKYTAVAAGNRVGTDYTTGDVSIDASGNVTGNGTTFDATMVGRGFKATGHSKWYRVKTYSTATAIVIEDDLDDVASAYTGGVIAGGTSYTIEAVTPVTVTTSNLLQYIAALKLKLNIAERYGMSTVPDAGRFLIVPPEFEDVLVRASGVALHVPEVYSQLVKAGFSTMLQGFQVFISNRLTGNNTDGWHIIAGHQNWMTFAEKLLTADMEEDIFGNFGTAYKDLFVYGAKVTDTRRQYATELYAKFTV